MTFDAALKVGKTGESIIAGFFKRKGYHILPVYEKSDNEYKGPAVFLADGTSVIAPDMLVFGKKTFWVEAKHKSAFTWHRLTGQWVTGIDMHHWGQYQIIAENSEWPVWLIFLHGKGTAKDTPNGMDSPTGLFGCDIANLKDRINHTHKNWGKNGMVYWGHSKLNFLCSLDDLA